MALGGDGTQKGRRGLTEPGRVGPDRIWQAAIMCQDSYARTYPLGLMRQHRQTLSRRRVDLAPRQSQPGEDEGAERAERDGRDHR